MWELDNKRGWVSKNWCFRTVVLEKTLESLLDSKEIKPVNPKGYQPCKLIGKTDAEAPILWPPDARSQLVGKDPDAGKDWSQEEKGMKEEEMVGWYHWFNGQEFEQTPGDSEKQGSLVWGSPWGHKQSDTLEQLKNNKAIEQNTTQPQIRWPEYWSFSISPSNEYSGLISFVAELYSSMLGQSQNHYAKKSDTTEYNPYDSIYTKCNLI